MIFKYCVVLFVFSFSSFFSVAGTASLTYLPASSLMVEHFTVIPPLVSNPRSGGTASLTYLPASSLMVEHFTVIPPLVSNPRSGASVVVARSIDSVSVDRANGDRFKQSKKSLKKVWIRETFPKNFTRPSLAQPIRPVLTRAGLLIQGNKVNGVVAYTLNKGKKQWFFSVKGGLAGEVSVVNDLVFFGGADGFIYAIYLSTGKLLWKHYTGLAQVSAPVVYKNQVYFSSSEKLYCLSKKTGDMLWTYSVSSPTAEFTVEGVAPPVIDKSLVYFKSPTALTAVNFKGRKRWTISTGVVSRFASSAGGLAIGKICLYFADSESGIYCVNKKTGRVIWKNPQGSHGDLLLQGSRLFYPSSDGKIIALDQKSGKQIWLQPAGKSSATSLVLYKDSLVYGEYRGPLRFVSLKTGERGRAFYFGEGMSAPPAVSVLNSELYFMSNSGWLYKLSLGD